MAKKISKKTVALAVSLVVCLGAVVGGTIAYLTDTTGPVTNVFTVGDIEITLYESEYDPSDNTIDGKKNVTGNDDYKIIPGREIPKDPTVTVLQGSEASWVFVKVTEENWDSYGETSWEDMLTYSIDTENWTALQGEDGVYYAQVDATPEAAVALDVLTDDQVTVSEDLTSEQMAVMAEHAPKLVFNAYAIQQEGLTTAAAAWEALGVE